MPGAGCSPRSTTAGGSRQGARSAAAPRRHLHEGRARARLVRAPGSRAASAAARRRTRLRPVERVTWDAALDDIAARLAPVVERYGPEAFAVVEQSLEHHADNGAPRRFMNLLGSPNWISGVALCAGNTAAINRMVYGWFPFPDFFQTKCIVLFGHNPKKPLAGRRSTTSSAARAAARGATRSCSTRARARRRARRPLAAAAGWDGCGDVPRLGEGHPRRGACTTATSSRSGRSASTTLKQRVAEYPLERVAAITGVDADLSARPRRACTRRAARRVIPWTPITDQQVSSTSAIRLHCTLRALTGNLDVPGGEVFTGFCPDIVPECDLELHDCLPEAQKAKQLGVRHATPPSPIAAPRRCAEPTEPGVGTEVGQHRLTARYMAKPAGRLPRHGRWHAVPGQRLHHAGQQHADGLRQHEAHLPTR